MTAGQALALVMLAAAVLVAAGARGEYRRAALMICAGLVATRLVVWATPSDWRYLASAAIWVSVGSDTIRRGLSGPGAMLILSGLCYGGAEIIAAPPAFGNPSLVGADLLWWSALVWTCGGGYHLGNHSAGEMVAVGRGRGRRIGLTRFRHNRPAQAACAPVTETT